MSKVEFPDPKLASEYGLLALGGELDLEHLLEAYSNGIFPWPSGETYPIPWFSPDPRGVLFFKDFHRSKSFLKFIKKTKFTVSVNTAFEKVILNCAQVTRKSQPNSWINQKIINGYTELFKNGHAYSIEVWEGDELVGGLYGVKINNYISGESMFHLRPNASKLALNHLVEFFVTKGIEWVDTQMVTPILAQFGAKEISRDEFINFLKMAT